MVMPAAAIAGVAAVAGSAMSANAASDAADAQVQASQDANATQLAMFNQNRADLAPWRQTGQNALNLYSNLLGIPGSDKSRANFDAQAYIKRYQDVADSPYWSQHPYEHYMATKPEEGRVFPTLIGGESGGSASPLNISAMLENTPGYQFQLQQGVNALQRSAAARGQLMSGGTAKDLMTFGQGLAGTTYQDYMNRLASTAGIGQTAATSTASLGQSTANAMGANTIYGGNARGTGYINTANAMTGGLNSMANNAMWLYGMGGFGGGGSLPSYGAAANYAASDPYTAGYYNPAMSYYYGG